MLDLAVRQAAYHGEGPMWSSREQRLYWLDMLAGDVCALDGDVVHRRSVGSTVGCVRESRSGFVVAADAGFAVLDADLAVVSRVEAWAPRPGLRMNEGGVDRQGRFYGGGLSDLGGRAGLYRLEPDLTAHPVLEGLSTSNGLVFPREGGALHIDSPTRRIVRYPAIDGGRWGPGELFAVVDDGVPDGMCLDAEGGVWVALWDGGAVVRYGPDGRLTHRVDLPVTRPTACAFGGPALDQLWITTSALDVSDPLAGSLFVLDAPVPGLAEPVAAY